MAQTVQLTGISRTRYIGTITVFVDSLSPLALQMVSDFDVAFFNQSEFGVSCSYNHSGLGKTVTYKTLVDDPTSDARMTSNTILLNSKMQIQLSTGHMLCEPNVNDTVLLKGILYTVDSYDDDGVGVVTIYLTRKNQGR